LQLYIGCSGWSYSAWLGHFYPKGLEGAKYLEYYSQVFDYVEKGLETLSPHLVRSIMPDKVKPYSIEEWPDVMIDDALGILDDNHWFTVASMMMTGLPKETEQDVIENIGFIDSMKLPMTIML
jgi:radical SAM superfamily enzyme YgiQ (UPF0313 family)